jgi:hypothetical protein
MEGSEHEMNKFLFDDHLLFCLYIHSNRDTCDDLIARDKMKTEHQIRKRRIENDLYPIPKK